MKPIFSDDPQAIEKLKKKLEYLEHNQQAMKNINVTFKKEWPCTDNYIGEHAYNVRNYGKPYPAWALTNNSAVIRSVKERIKRLEK
jgi:hypothetical protein